MSYQELINAAKLQVIAFNEKDWDKYRNSVTTDFVYDEAATHRKLVGINQVLEGLQGWGSAFPDSHATFENEFTDGKRVVLELTWRGKNTGSLQTPDGEIPATGMSIEMRACEIVEIENGKAKSVHHYFDMMTMMKQMGVVK